MGEAFFGTPDSPQLEKDYLALHIGFLSRILLEKVFLLRLGVMV